MRPRSFALLRNTVPVTSTGLLYCGASPPPTLTVTVPPSGASHSRATAAGSRTGTYETRSLPSASSAFSIFVPSPGAPVPVVSAASQTTMVPKNRASPDLFAIATACSGVMPFACGTVRTAQQRSASSSAVFSASSRSPSVTATVDQPSSGSSSQR